MNQTSETTVGASTAGAALGGIVGWTISAVTGVDTAPISGGLATVGAFVFGSLFPR